MAAALDSWEAVEAYALTLPGAERGSYYGGPAIKIAANGRPVATQGRETDSFCLHIANEQKAMMMDIDPDRYWQTPHYDGWPALLVRYAGDDEAAHWIERAAELAAAKKPARKK